MFILKDRRIKMEKKKIGYNLRLPDDLHKKLKIRAAEVERTMSDIIIELVERWLQTNEIDPKKKE